MRKDMRLCAKWLLIFSIFALGGCASYQALRSDFTNYSEIYGEESNKQLLLNLARLANENPVYYIQLGTISSQYQVTESLQFTGGNTRTTTQPGRLGGTNTGPKGLVNALALGGQANMGIVQTPLFSFVPLTGSNLVQAVLAPIDHKVYMTFFDQGFAADLIARTIISQVELQHISTNVAHTITPGAITIQTKGVDPKMIAYILNLAPNNVSNDTGTLLIRPKLVKDTNLVAQITNSVIFPNDLFWVMNSFVVRTNAVDADLLKQVDPIAKSIYTNSITIDRFSFSTNDSGMFSIHTNSLGSNILSFIQSALPAGAVSVSKIMVDSNSIPTNIWPLITNSGMKTAVSPFASNQCIISLQSLTPDMAAYITNSIYTNSVTVLTNYEILVDNPRNPTYAKFLEFCADLRDAQVCRILTVDTLNGSTTTNVVYGKDKRNPSLADVTGAIGANLSVAADTNGNIVISQASQTPHFAAKGPLDKENFQLYTNLLNPSANYCTSYTYDTAWGISRIIDASNLVQDIINKKDNA